MSFSSARRPPTPRRRWIRRYRSENRMGLLPEEGAPCYRAADPESRKLNPSGSLRAFGSHRIRHATTTLLVNNGMPLEGMSRYLGHSSTDVTRRYARQTQIG